MDSIPSGVVVQTTSIVIGGAYKAVKHHVQISAMFIAAVGYKEAFM